MTLSPQVADLAAGVRDGYVALIAADGSVAALETEGMDVARAAWSEEGLHFSDLNREYLLDEEGLVSSARDSLQDYQEANVALPGGGSVAVYNVGVEGDRYLELVVAHRDGDLRHEVVEGYPYVLGACGEEIYAISESKAEAWPELRAEEGPAFVLSRIYSPVIDQQQFVAEVQRSSREVFENRNVPCVDGDLLALSRNDDGALTLVRWDVQTGARHDVPVTGDDGQLLRLSADEHLFSQYGPGSVHEGELLWASGDQRLLATSVETGRTRVIVDLVLTDNSDWDSRFVFDRGRVAILDVANSYESDVRLLVYEAQDGRKLLDEVVTNLNRLRSDQMLIRDLAIDRQWLRGLR